QADALAHDFFDLYPDHAWLGSDVVNAAGQRLVDNMRASGRLPEQELREDRAGFLQELALEVEHPSDADGRYWSHEEVEVNRTGGIAGGSTGYSRPQRARRDEQPGSLVDDVREIQRKQGWY